MNDFDLDRLGDVWRQQPDPAELERLQRTAAAVARRARLSSIMDILAAIVVAVVVIVFVTSNPRTQTVMMGAAAILVLLGSNIRQRKLRQVELKGLTGTTEDMLDQSIERVETTVRHNRFTLYAMGPAIIIAFLFATIAIPRTGTLVSWFSEVPMARMLWSAAWVVVIAASVIFVGYSVKRGRRELERLLVMREAYRHERESSGQ
jgi:hypothetical protein